MNKLLDAALRAAKRGWAVIPCWNATDDGTCACGKPDCKSVGKHPNGFLVGNGLNTWSRDPATISSWWAQYPDSSVAVVMQPSGLVAFDVDLYKGDREKLEALVAEHGELPETLEQISGSREGVHILYKSPGIDIRGHINGITLRSKAYLVIAPSKHRLGGNYEWDGDPDAVPTAHLPPAWVEALAKDIKLGEGAGVPDDEPAWLVAISQEARVEHARRHLAKEAPEVKGESPPGMMFNVCRSIVRGYAIHDPLVAYELVSVYNQRCVPPYDTEALANKIASAYEKAENPEWGARIKEVADRELTVQLIKAKEVQLKANDKAKVVESRLNAGLSASPTHEAYTSHWRQFVADNVRKNKRDADVVKRLLTFDMLKSKPISDGAEIVYTIKILIENELAGSTDEQHLSFIGNALEQEGKPVPPADILEAITDVRTQIAEEPESAEPTNDAEVAALLKQSDKGPKSCGSNVAKIFRYASDLRGHIRFNDLLKTVEIHGGPFSGVAMNDLPVLLANWLEDVWGVFASTAMVGEQLLTVARRNFSYDPVQDYLNDLVWDGVRRLDTWLFDYADADEIDQDGDDVSDFVSKAGARWMISAVARALSPGCKVDTVLVLEGGQGARKSSALRILGGAWFTDTPLVMGDKDSRMLSASRWICELAELASVVKSDIETQKAFLSAQRDDFRPPYGRVIEQFDRHCVFAGTVNPEIDGEVNYLSDSTGDRRWWPVRVGHIDKVRLVADRDQLWAEAAFRYKSSALNPEFAHAECPGERWWFETEEQIEVDKIARKRHSENVWVNVLRSWADKQSTFVSGALGLKPPAMRTEWTMETIAAGALEISKSDLQRHSKLLSAALRQAGFVPVRRLKDGKRISLWAKGEAN